MAHCSRFKCCARARDGIVCTLAWQDCGCGSRVETYQVSVGRDIMRQPVERNCVLRGGRSVGLDAPWVGAPWDPVLVDTSTSRCPDVLALEAKLHTSRRQTRQTSACRPVQPSQQSSAEESLFARRDARRLVGIIRARKCGIGFRRGPADPTPACPGTSEPPVRPL